MKSIFQFYMALHLVFMERREEAAESPVVWFWFKRCLGLPLLSLFLSVARSDFHWTQHFWKKQVTRRVVWLDAESVDTWSAAAPGGSVGGEGWGKELPFSLRPPGFNVPTDGNRTPDWKCNSRPSALHLYFAAFTLVVITWGPDPPPCSKWWKSHWQRERTRLSTDFPL